MVVQTPEGGLLCQIPFPDQTQLDQKSRAEIFSVQEQKNA